tara:strand:+ start:2038 stop:4425 length:2388 start_codon:yes stop_codon:yes gene_type:complete
MSINVNANPDSKLNPKKEYFGNYLGIVIQNNDPDKGGKIKIWIPHISPTVYKNWEETNEDKSFKFIGRNIDSDITDIVEELKKIIPWAECAAPIIGSISPGRYNAYEQKATISDSNKATSIYPSDDDESVGELKYKLNDDGIGEKPAHKYEIHKLKVSDAFTDKDEVKFNNLNKFAYNYVPTSYSNSAKGSFSIPNVGAHVWVFFAEGDPNNPIYFAATHGTDEWKTIFNNFTSDGLDYPGAYENIPSELDPNYNHNTETYRNKYVINQKGGTIEIVSTDNREILKLTHYSGSFKEFNNDVNIEFATNNNQKLVQGDEFFTIKGFKNTYVGRDYDQIINGDYYKKIGNLNQQLQKEWRDLMEPVGDAKQLFEIKRALTIIDDNESIKKTSGAQDQEKIGDGFGPCPLCSEITTRDRIWENSYAFTSVTPNYSYTSTLTSNNTGTLFPFTSEVVSVNSDTRSKQISPSPGFFAHKACPVCGGSEKSPSSYNGTWAKENKDDLIITSIRGKIKELINLEKRLGLGGSEIINISKHKIENIGLINNDFPSVRIDEKGKIENYEAKVFAKGVATTKKESALIEYVHVDDFPGGDFTQNIGNKWNVLVGSGGVSIKSSGGVDIGGTITNIAGQQVNISSEYEINMSSKRVNIAAEMLTLRNKNNRQVLVDGNLGVNQNVVIGGSLHVEGELSVHHITAPVEIQETEPVVVFSRLLSGLSFQASGPWSHGGTGTITLTTDSNADKVEAYPHTHPFKNVPLKLMKDKDEVRKVGAKLTDHQGMTAAIPVVHEKKTRETGPTS